MKWLTRRRCRAVLEPRAQQPYHGRCELDAGHTAAHELERGLDTVRWTTSVVLGATTPSSPGSSPWSP